MLRTLKKQIKEKSKAGLFSSCFRGVEFAVKNLFFVIVLLIYPITSVAQVSGLPNFKELIKSSTPAVVKINTATDSSYSGSSRDSTGGVGSGFIISDDGYIVTNHHVVDGAGRIIVRLNDRREYNADLIGSDSRSDLALLKIEENGLPSLEFADSGILEPGDWVLAIGSPFDLDYSASAGIVSAIGRSLPDGSGQDYVPFIQTDVAINPGNSGGPLFNLSGEVVGINSQIFTRSGGFMGLSFAVPSAVAVSVIEQLKTNGEVSRGWLGVAIQDVTGELAKGFGLDKPQGALVSSVQPDGPADKSGILAGDIIIAFDGKPIDYSHDLPHVVGLVQPGVSTDALVVREKREQKIAVEVGSLNQFSRTGRAVLDTPDLPKPSSNTSLGLILQDIDPKRALDLNLSGGVLVSEVTPSSAGARAGLLAGDVITQIAFEDVSSINGFQQTINRLRKGEIVPILFYRNGVAVFRTIQVDD